MKSDKSSKAVNVDGQPSVFARHNAEMNIPLPPLTGGKSEAKGGCYPFKGGTQKRSALGKQANASSFVLGPRAVSRRSSEQGERKSGCPSEASYLIFRLASVAKACEAHEALTFWLLLGQAKSDKKEILRFALNDKRPNTEGHHPPSPLQRGNTKLIADY